jgi:pimeloyl-ACP methyl ester carboxylesterase
MPPRVCLLTVHGIGFQQPPTGGRDGYADGLHEHLRKVLGDRLGEDCEDPADPERPRGGPVYVQSEVEGKRELGLGRLDRELTAGGDIAHVALVYAPSLPPDHHFSETVETVARAAASLGRYTSVIGALKLLGRDLWAIVDHPHHDDDASSLRPRTDVPRTRHLGRLADVTDALCGGGADDAGSASSPNVLSAIEADVATYVSRNDLRERVRGFVQEAVTRLLDSDDVELLVVNAHSQGSVVCWDVLCRLPVYSWSKRDPARARKVRALVTAGSPIRKYVDLFDWGGRVGQMEALSMPPFVWQNFWDARDPIADPLNPPVSWKPGQPPTSPTSAEDALLVAVDPDSGARRPFAVDDRLIDNVEYSRGGGLQAHDYWNNTEQFVPALKKLLDECAAP